jgi:hypothetical protein
MTLSELVTRAEGGERRLARVAEQPTWTDPEIGYRRRAVSPVNGGPLELVEVELPAGAEVSFSADTQLGPPAPCTYADRTQEPVRYLVALGKRAG